MNTPKLGLPLGNLAPYLAVSTSFTANQVTAVLFEVSACSITINNVLWNLLGGVVNAAVGLGIYAVTTGSLTRGTRLADTGPLPAAVANQGVNTSPFIAPVTLRCGIYCMAFNTNSAAITLSGMSPAGNNITVLNMYNQKPEGFIGTAANAGVAGQLPTTLGLITATGAAKFPVLMLSN